MTLRIASLAMAALLGACAAPPRSEPKESGCSKPTPPAAPAARVGEPAALLARVWQCTGGRSVTVYPRADAADIVVNGCQMAMTRVASDTGTLYENKTLAFWDQGTNASLVSKAGAVMGCREVPLLSHIEDARVRGVTWRGHALDGSWHIDIGPGPWLAFVQAGAPAQVFGRSARVTNPNTGSTLYTANRGERTISVEVATQVCRDRSGNTLPGSVQISLEGAAYQGCGIPLSR